MAYVILQVPGAGEVISSSFLTRIRDNQEFLKNVPGVGAEFERFTSSGTWTKPADINWVYAMVIGAGAGGAWASSTGELGGVPGSIGQFLIRASDLGATEIVTVGSGGDGGVTATLGTSSYAQGGGAGGDSAFGAYRAPGGHTRLYSVAVGQNSPMYTVPLPGTGGSSVGPRVGFPGLGQSTFTARAADGAGSSTGTGAGGGGGTSSNSRSGDGGAPGGGGGAKIGGNSTTSGDGARGEVRVWGW